MLYALCLSRIVTENLKHLIGPLFRPPQRINKIACFITVYQDMLRRRDEAMLDPSVTADGILVSPGVEETDVQGFCIFLLESGQKYLLVEVFKIVIIRFKFRSIIN
jgi:hypothetical protein